MASWVQEQRWRVDIEGLLRYDKVDFWVGGLKVGSSRKTALYHLAAFTRWRVANHLESNPDLLIQACLDGTQKTLIEHLRVLKSWVEGETFDGSERATRDKYYKDIRSFYKHNLCELPSSPLRFNSKSTTSGTLGVKVDIPATEYLEFARKVVSSRECSMRDKAIVMVMLQSGMDDSTLAEVFNYVGFPQLAKHFGSEDWNSWSLELCPVRIDLVRPKSNYRYYSFLAEDSVRSLIEWLNLRQSLTGKGIRIFDSQRPNQHPPSDTIFLVGGKRPIRPYLVSKIFRDLGVRTGINVRPTEKPDKYKGASIRYPFHSHEVRDTLVTIGRKAGVDAARALQMGFGLDS